ncbi:hypothetical protein GW17_00051973 [Ensete ventricosum]|nr:hypothetical protein GW17_00051973 [Ensete ventricosum]RZR89720.1 hypothetical protein BHM03_00017493 [Ensete ventricosum]
MASWPNTSIVNESNQIRDQRGVSLQRSIVQIPLERRTLDLLSSSPPGSEIQGYTISLVFVLISAAHVMHPLRFPNSGISAKVFVRKIGFKLRAMRLNRVESFNTFTTRTSSRRGWPWLAGNGQPPLQGRSVAAKAPLQGGCRPPTRDGHWRPARKTLPTAHPQEAAHVAPARGYRQQGWRCRPPLGNAVADHNA